jgi:glutathione S-transferase
MANTLTLISHALCPYVQRAAIALAEKGIAFERIDIDLANKPAWFLQVSPLGKTPVLLVDGEAIFESAVICEYLDDTTLPRLHPENALQRAQHRAWMEFGSATLNTIAGFYSAQDNAALSQKATELRAKFGQLETQLGTGPYFAGERFSLVDAVFGPVFRYFDVLDLYTEQAFFDGLPKVQAWRAALALRPTVVRAVAPNYADLLTQFLRKRTGALAARMQGTHASPAIAQPVCTI